MSNVRIGLTELEDEVNRMIEIAEKEYEKELDGCSFKYGTIVYKMKDWIGNNSPLADYLEEYFKEKYYNVYQEIDKRHLCFNYSVVIELLDISVLDNIIRDILPPINE